jgi:hypothetical protein
MGRIQSFGVLKRMVYIVTTGLKRIKLYDNIPADLKHQASLKTILLVQGVRPNCIIRHMIGQNINLFHDESCLLGYNAV